MADKIINWPPPKEALFPLVKFLARVMVERDMAAARKARRQEFAEKRFPVDNGGPMHLAQKVNDYISKRRPDTICDGCIARAMDIRHQQANRVTMALGTTSDFDRGNGICADCGKEHKVIRRT